MEGITMSKKVLSIVLVYMVSLFFTGCSKQNLSSVEGASNFVPTLSVKEKTNLNGTPVSTSTEEVDIEDVEKYVDELLRGEDNQSKETRDKIFKVLPKLNWPEYISIAPNDEVMGQNRNLINWLFAIDPKTYNDAEIISFFKSMHELDGAYAEGYVDILNEIFYNNPVGFVVDVEKLSLVDTKQADNICYWVRQFDAHEKDIKNAQIILDDYYSSATPLQKDIISKILNQLIQEDSKE